LSSLNKKPTNVEVKTVGRGFSETYGRIAWDHDFEEDKKKPFDLQVWLEQFDKQKIFKDLNEDLKYVQPVYNKNESFFDNLVSDIHPKLQQNERSENRRESNRGNGAYRGRYSYRYGQRRRRFGGENPTPAEEEHDVEEKNQILFTNLFHLNEGGMGGRGGPGRGRISRRRGGVVSAYDQSRDDRYKRDGGYEDRDERRSNSDSPSSWEYSFHGRSSRSRRRGGGGRFGRGRGRGESYQSKYNDF
jgi:hypothetical protein